MNDFDENATFGTNPLQADTDGDGLIDSNETIEGTNPLLTDTDGDGFSDALEQENPLLNPLQINTVVAISGAIYNQETYPLFFIYEYSRAPLIAMVWRSNYLKTMNLLYRKTNSFPQTYLFPDLISALL